MDGIDIWTFKCKNIKYKILISILKRGSEGIEIWEIKMDKL